MRDVLPERYRYVCDRCKSSDSFEKDTEFVWKGWSETVLKVGGMRGYVSVYLCPVCVEATALRSPFTQLKK